MTGKEDEAHVPSGARRATEEHPIAPVMDAMDDAQLDLLREQLETADSPIRSLVIARRGETIFTHHRPGTELHDAHPINSITKTVLGLIVGVAIRQGLLALDTRLADLLPAAAAPDLDPRVRMITIRHLLTMTSGYAWNERQMDPLLLHASHDLDGAGRLSRILHRDFAHDPGSHFEYDSHAAHLLAMCVHHASGGLYEFAVASLFEPLGIPAPEWERDEDGLPFGGRGLRISAPDLLKFGLLVLAEGHWQGQTMLDAAYLREATRNHHVGSLPLDSSHAGYGYLWWVDLGRKHQAPYYAAGFGEQYLFVEPRLQLVTAVLADSTKTHKYVRRWWTDLICESAGAVV